MALRLSIQLGSGRVIRTGCRIQGHQNRWLACGLLLSGLAGDRLAFIDKHSGQTIKANWSNGKVAMTGKSYLGTLATAVATTGVRGLETVISEAAISDWYQYYRDNGLVIAPGGFPGEDVDVLAELVYSRMLNRADCTVPRCNGMGSSMQRLSIWIVPPVITIRTLMRVIT